VSVVVSDPDARQAREERITEAIRERHRVYEALRRMDGVEVHASVTNFLLFAVADASGTYDRLLQRGVRIRRQDHLHGLAGHLRVSMGSPEENDRFLDALRRVVTSEVSHG